jgi:hypothetical protein
MVCLLHQSEEVEIAGLLVAVGQLSECARRAPLYRGSAGLVFLLSDFYSKEFWNANY